MTFTKATRRQVHPKLALTGPSGSGKTFSGLLLASGMGKKIAVIDTENGSASLYADMDKGELKGVGFDVLEIAPPYTIDKYAQAIEAAQSAGYDVLVVDSISHAWAGEGGLLAKKEALDNRGGNQNSYTNWASITKEHELFKARILNADIILICTMRSKQDYVLEMNDKGKQAPKKVGMAPVQREGMEYEFTTVFDLAMDHNAAASKDRTSMFDGQIFKITKKTGEQIMAWLKGAKPVEKAVAAPAKPSAPPATKKVEKPEPAPWESGDEGEGDDVPAITEKQAAKISGLIKSVIGPRRSEETVWIGIHKQVPHDFSEVSELSELEAGAVIDYLTRWLDHIHPAPQPPEAEA
jgi:hypothetical protein